MKTFRKPFALFTGNDILDAVCLVLILGVLANLLLNMTGGGYLMEGTVSFQKNAIALFLLISLPLLPGIPIQYARALRERESRKQEPAECPLDASPREYVFFWKGGPQEMIPSCIAFLERHFSRYYVFHRFHPPHLFYTYLAKSGAASLFALPWIKTGLVVFFVCCSMHLALPSLISPSTGRLIVLLVAISCWIPGLWLLCFHPYRKLWLQVLDQGGCVQIRLTCASPFRPMKRDALCLALEATVRAWQDPQLRPGLPAETISP